MIESFAISTDRLLADLRQLCAQPSGPGQPDDLAQAATHVAALMRQHGLHTDLLMTSGAPLVVGRLEGRSPFTLLLYHHYDVAPVGRWNAWHHDPFQLAERDDAVYGRGVADGKGPLVAHLAALAALLRTGGELPCGVVIIAEGEALVGSAGLSANIGKLAAQFRADACLATGGERNADGLPICYSGAKGLVQARLKVAGARQTLAPGLAASVPNPLWRLVWALANIKNEQEEVLVAGFYEAVGGPTRSENQLIRTVKLDEATRLAAWGLEQFLAESTGAGLMQIESALPTCNVSTIAVEPSGDLAAVPTAASALLDMQLVPLQQPDVIIDLIGKHLVERGLAEVAVERLPGGYPAAHTPLDAPFIQQISAAALALYGAPIDRLPFGPFALPLARLADAFALPVAVVGCTRPDSAIHGPNEHMRLDDLVQHGQLLVELLHLCAQAGDDDTTTRRHDDTTTR